MNAPTLAQLQAEFKSYLFSGSNEAAFAPCIAAGNGINATRRLDVYRNAYYIRLQEALAHDFPALLIDMGEAAFGREMAAYLKACPSTSPSLRQLGERLPGYLLSRNKAHWADLARVEWAILNAFDAADADALTVDDMQHIPPDAWQVLHFALHPSVSVLEVSHHAFDVWAAHHQKQALRDRQIHETVPLLIWRSPGGPTIKPLSIECHTLLVALGDGQSFAQACEQFLAFIAPDDIAQAAAGSLLELLQSGCLSIQE